MRLDSLPTSGCWEKRSNNVIRNKRQPAAKQKRDLVNHSCFCNLPSIGPSRSRKCEARPLDRVGYARSDGGLEEAQRGEAVCLRSHSQEKGRSASSSGISWAPQPFVYLLPFSNAWRATVVTRCCTSDRGQGCQ